MNDYEVSFASDSASLGYSVSSSMLSGFYQRTNSNSDQRCSIEFELILHIIIPREGITSAPIAQSF